MPPELSEQEKLIRSRGSYKGQLTSFEKYLRIVEAKPTLSDVDFLEIQDRISKIEDVYGKFVAIQDQIEMLISENDFEKELENRANFESQYFSLVASAKAFVKVDNGQNNDSDSASNISGHSTRFAEPESSAFSSVKLPTITLPKFNGNYNVWLEFRDIFSSLIHENSSLAPIQKFHYLRASLEGSAALVIKSLEFCNDNYDIAWTTLCQRYNNKRLLIHRHMKSLFSLEPLEKESCFKIRSLIDSVSKNLSFLSQLGEPVEHWGTIVNHLVCTKLDSVTLREWEQHFDHFVKVEVESTNVEANNDSNDKLTWYNLKEFLKNGADLLETLEQREKGREDKGRQHNNKRANNVGNNGRTKSGYENNTLVSSGGGCIFCKGEHDVTKCQNLLSLPAQSRLEKVKLAFVNSLHYGVGKSI